MSRRSRARSATPGLMRMENLRRAVQVMSFLAYVYLFLLTVGIYDPAVKQMALKSAAPIDTFFRMDPLLGLTAMLSVRRVVFVMLVYGLPVVLLTVVAGRFFCGWICPLGTVLDATDTLFFRRRKARKPDTSRRNIKYYLLGATLIAAIFSSQIAYLLDPITILTRALTLSVYPVLQLAGRSASDAGLTLPGLSASQFFPQGVHYFFRLNFLAAAILIAILAANALSRRFWCRNLCPLGALLALVSKFSIVRRRVSDTCTQCQRCAPGCKMAAIMEDPAQYQAPECVYCYACTSACPEMSTVIAPSFAADGYHSALDLNRRRVFQAAGVGALVALLGRTNPAAKTSRAAKLRISSESLIRPPGALPEDEFIDRCIRCSECMKVCPTGGLQPALSEAGFEGLWTPVLIPRIGECTQNCNLCGQVCSSQAIQPFTIAEKKHIFIGRAVIDRSHCYAWNSDRKCLVCDEACSYDAVYWRKVESAKRPFVNEHRCVGCGICESVCPIQPLAAIRVFSFGDQRHRSREQQRSFYEQSTIKEQGLGIKG